MEFTLGLKTVHQTLAVKKSCRKTKIFFAQQLLQNESRLFSHHDVRRLRNPQLFLDRKRPQFFYATKSRPNRGHQTRIRKKKNTKAGDLMRFNFLRRPSFFWLAAGATVPLGTCPSSVRTLSATRSRNARRRTLFHRKSTPGISSTKLWRPKGEERKKNLDLDPLLDDVCDTHG